MKEKKRKMIGLSQSKDFIHMKREREIMGFGRSKDLDLLMFMKEKSTKIMGWAEVKIWISIGNKQKNDRSEPM